MASVSEPSADPTSPDAWSRWRESFSTWWQGQEPIGPAEDGGAEDEAERIEPVDDPADSEEADPDSKKPLSPRLLLMQRIWGEGFTSPGGAFHTLDLVKPLGLTGSRDLLHFGAGLGAPARPSLEWIGDSPPPGTTQ